MSDACEIRAVDVLGTLNEVTLQYNEGPGAVLWSGPCMVNQSPDRSATEENAGEQVQHDSHTVRVPADAPTPELGMVLEITASVLNPDMVGMLLDVTGQRDATNLVSKILGCRTQERSSTVA